MTFAPSEQSTVKTSILSECTHMHAHTTQTHTICSTKDSSVTAHVNICIHIWPCYSYINIFMFECTHMHARTHASHVDIKHKTYLPLNENDRWLALIHHIHGSQ